MTPSSVTQFITITFPISCPFDLDGAIQMRHLVIAETGVIPDSCSRRPSRKFTPRSYSPKCVEWGFCELLRLDRVLGSRGLLVVIGGEDTGTALEHPLIEEQGVDTNGRARVVLGYVDRRHGRRTRGG